MASADFSQTNDTEEMNPLQRAKDRLSNHIFQNYNIVPDEEELSKMIVDLLPYIACHLALFHANEAVEEIVARQRAA